MRAIRADHRRWSVWYVLLLIVVAFAVGGAGTVAALGALEVIDLGKLAFWHKPVTIPEGWVGIPVCAKPIPAYSTVSREYLLDPRMDGSWLLRYVSPGSAEELARSGVIRDIDKIRGRVTAREKPGAQFFYERDFLPIGTRPGVAGGTPLGKQAYPIVVTKQLHGVYDLREGDHINLVASIPVDMPGSARSGVARLGTVVASPEATMLSKRGVVRPLVQDGVVVSPVRLRNIPVATKNGVVTRTLPQEEIVIAVDPEEVAPLAEALDLKYEITCVARSGRPRDTELPSPQPSREVAAVSADRAKPAADQVRPAVDQARPAAAQARPAAEQARPTTEQARPTTDNPRPTADARTADVTKPKGGDVTPGYNPMGETRFMEIMVGSQRQFVVFGGPNAGPVAASQEGGAAKPDGQAQPGGEHP